MKLEGNVVIEDNIQTHGAGTNLMSTNNKITQNLLPRIDNVGSIQHHLTDLKLSYLSSFHVLLT